MKRRKKLLVATLLAMGVMALFFVAGRDDEPSYHGKRLSQWLDDPYWPSENVDALRAIGIKAVPCLLKWMQYEQSPTRYKLFELVEKLPWEFPDPRITLAREATEAFAWLGPEATSVAIAQLGILLNSTNTSAQYSAESALCAIGTPALPVWLDVLTNQPAHRYVPVGVLPDIWNRLGAKASPATPIIIAHLQDSDETTAKACAEMLTPHTVRESDTTAVLSGLCAALQSTNLDLRVAALYAIKSFGVYGRAAAPKVLKILTDRDAGVRACATNTLLEIAPDLLQKNSEQDKEHSRRTTRS